MAAKPNKKRKKPVRVVDVGAVMRPEFVTDPEVYEDFQEAAQLKPNGRQAKQQRSVTELSGGDVDAAVDEAAGE
jgi:hypothetical protein